VLQRAGANKIIAVNVLPTAMDVLEKRLIVDELRENELRMISQKNIFARAWYRFRKMVAKRFFPNIFDILMNTIQYMETEISEVEGEAADLVIRPIVAHSSWVDFFKPQQFIKRGEDEAMKLMPKIKALVSQQSN
jgi:predicted acylesterase/phospholipase RssA